MHQTATGFVPTVEVMLPKPRLLPDLKRTLPTRRRVALAMAVTASVVVAAGSAHAADSVVVFNEIHYHPADDAGGAEWVELHNLMGVDVDISGWSLAGGIALTFAEGTVLEGHGFRVAAADPDAPELGGAAVFASAFTGRLANGGETLLLLNRDGRVMDRVAYGDSGDWPAGADGSGATLAKRDEATAEARPANWRASPEVGGTPGRPNFPAGDAPPAVVELLGRDTVWRFEDSGSPPSLFWKDAVYNDAGWAAGPGLHFAGDAGPAGGGEGLLGYWRLDETSGTIAANAVPGGNAGALVNGPAWVADPERGRVLAFDGADDYASLGAATIPRLTTANDFTWAFWANTAEGPNNDVIVGNRYSPGGGDFSPREFIKFTTNQFEYHRGGSGENIDYGDIPTGVWVHHAVVKDGANLTYYRDGTAAGSTTVTQGLNNPQPLYLGGDQAQENWQGRLDDVAIWAIALPAEAVAGLADGTYTPDTAPSEGGPGNLRTELELGSTAYYFRAPFTYNGAPERTALSLRLTVDDGAVVYLNRTEVYRQNMPAGAVGHGTLAAGAVDVAVTGPAVTIPAGALLRGENVIAVEVHQASPGDGDMVFGLSLTATEQPPGAAGGSAGPVFNEIAAAGDPSFQVELANPGGAEINLAGYRITSSGGDSFTFPGGAALAGDGFLTLDVDTLGFRPADGDRLFLYAPGGGELVDARAVTGRLRGRAALESGPGGGRWLYPAAPTFGAANAFAFRRDIVINEIMYHPRPLPSTPDTPATFETSRLLGWGASWRYNQSGEDLGAGWSGAAHAVGGNWSAGAGPIGFEPHALPVPIVTPLRDPGTNNPYVRTYYFETDFELDAAQLASLGELQLEHQIDDGAVFYLNGAEIARHDMPGGAVTAATFAQGGGEAALIGPVEVPADALVAGTNRLSVEVHQTSGTSSDVVFGLQLFAAETLTPFVPGEPFRASDAQFIELYNRGSEPVDLAGWRFADGVDFEFSAGAEIGPGELLVLAENAAAFAAVYPGVELAGQWRGSLSRAGERLRLVDAFGNPVDEVRYVDGGAWPGRADGGGASLELRDPRADNALPGAWAASATGGPWRSYSITGRGSGGGGPTRFNEFIFGLLDEGELLIDDISVVEDPGGAARELIQNGDFGGGDTRAWRLIGNHRHAAVVDDPDDPGNPVLHLRASGSTEHMHNHAETTLKSGASFVTIDGGLDYRVSFRARWLGGSNQFNTRLYFNRLARTHILEAPEGGGTPGAANSAFTANAGPAFDALAHSPAVPAAGAPVTVSARVDDPDGVAAVELFYSVDGGAFASLPMALTGAAGGTWAASIPPQAGGAVVQFYLQAGDTLGQSTQHPAGGPASRALIPYADGQANLDYGNCQPNNFRIVMTPADTDFLHHIEEVMSNDRLGATVVYNEREVTYDCGVRLKGSQRGRGKDVRAGFNVRFPADRPFLGRHGTVAVDRSGAGDQFSQKEILVKHAINHAGGVPGMYDDLVRVIAPRSNHTGSAMLLKSRFDDEWFDGGPIDQGDEGRMFEYELIYYPAVPNGGVEARKVPPPAQSDSVTGVAVRNLGGTDKELYRHHWQVKNNRDADDYAGLVEFLTAMSLSGTAYRDATDRLLDVDQWLRSFAAQILFGIGDNYSGGSQHNAIVYLRPADGRAMLFPWDMDFTFSRGASADLTPNGDLDRLIAASPANRRAYYGHVLDIVTTTCNRAYMDRWTEHYSCFLPSENLNGFRSYIGTRATTALAEVRGAVAEVPYRITTADGTAAPGSTATVSGDGWVDVREIRLAGSAGSLPVTWTDENSWQVAVPVVPGANTVTLEAYGHRGQLVGTDTVSLTGTGTTVTARATNLAITQVMYHPADPTPAEREAGFDDADAFEYIELLNLSPALTVDLAGAAFTDGIDYPLPARTLAPGSRLVVAGNLAAFRHRYGDGPDAVGGYQNAGANQLSNGGERLALDDALGQPIAVLTYGDDPPWPTSADGAGYALVLMRPGRADPADPRSWRTGAAPGGAPGLDDARRLDAWLTDNNLNPDDLAADPDRDGLPNILEYAAGQNPNHPNANSPLRAALQRPATSDTQHLVLAFTQLIGTDDLDFTVEYSEDLITWQPLGPESYAGRTNNDDGTAQLQFRATQPLSNAPAQYLRLVLRDGRGAE